LKKAWLDGEPFRPLRIRIKTRFTRMVSPLLRVLYRPETQPRGTVRDAQKQASASYQPKVYPGTVTLFRCTEKGSIEGNDDRLGWGNLAAEGVELHYVPSRHLTILSEPAVKVLAEQLRECLDRDLAPLPPSRQSQPANSLEARVG
jgi:hypothetical protein